MLRYAPTLVAPMYALIPSTIGLVILRCAPTLVALMYALITVVILITTVAISITTVPPSPSSNRDTNAPTPTTRTTHQSHEFTIGACLASISLCGFFDQPINFPGFFLYDTSERMHHSIAHRSPLLAVHRHFFSKTSAAARIILNRVFFSLFS
jgi:hypothetical protein